MELGKQLMSRTDKDRPWYIQSSDPTELRYAHHNHSRFGQKIVYSRLVTDADGNSVYEEYNVKYVVDHCTINEIPASVASIHIYRLYPCYYSLIRRWGAPDKDDKRAYHSSIRRREYDTLNVIKKRYNAAEDIEEISASEELNSAGRIMHIGYWD